MISMQAKANVLSTRLAASAGTSLNASKMLLTASDSVPRVNTKRLRTSLNRYGMLNRAATATSPVPT